MKRADCGCVFRLTGARFCTFVHVIWCGGCALKAFRATGEWPVTS